MSAEECEILLDVIPELFLYFLVNLDLHAWTLEPLLQAFFMCRFHGTKLLLSTQFKETHLNCA